MGKDQRRDILNDSTGQDHELTPYAMPSQDVVSALQSDAKNGLDQQAIPALQSKFGLNEIAEAKPIPAWIKLLAQFRGLIIWILIIAAVIAGLMGEWADTITILVIVVLNGVLGFLQESRAERALSALKAMSSPMAKVRRNGQSHSIAASQLVPGDLLLLEAGDKVPADARLIEGFGIAVQEAALTGESSPVNKDPGVSLEAQVSIGDRINMIFMGTVVASGKATAMVTATGMRTEFGGIAELLSRTESEPTPLQRRLAELGRLLVGICLVFVAIIFVLQYLRGGTLLDTLLIAVSLAVAAVPEGLPAVVTIALAIGLKRMVKRNALIRKLPSVETLGSVTIICSDKTGTLTRNEMTVRSLCQADQCYEVTGTGYVPQGEFVPVESATPAELSRDDLTQLLTIAARCNSASLVPDPAGDNWSVIGDPTEGALLVMAMKGHVDLDGSQRKVIFEIPFDSERKAMSVIERDAHGKVVLYNKGAPEVVLEKCQSELRQGQAVPLTDQRKQEILAQSSDMAGRALRVLGFAFRNDPEQEGGGYVEHDLVFAGLVGMIDPPREEVKLAVNECNLAGIRPVMITGDHPETAIAIGMELGIAPANSRAVTGVELDAMTDEALEQSIDQFSVYARVSAAHKMRVVKAWKSRGQVVAMTGDGVNDAPAVKAADIGIAMGITGTDVTKEAADMVLTDDNFASIVAAVKEGRGIFDNIQKFVHYLLSCNAGEVLLMLGAAIIGWPVPLLAIQILWINLVTDGLPALALAVEPPEPDIMERPPRRPREPVIHYRTGMLILYHGSLMTVVSLLGFWWVYEGNPENVDSARTAAFAVCSFSQLAFALVCRSHRYTLPQLGLFSNSWLFVAIIGSGLLQLGVLFIPLLQGVFNVVPMSATIWTRVIVLSLGPATVIELAKIVWSWLIFRKSEQHVRAAS